MSVLFDGVQGVDVFDADYRTRQGVGNGELVAKELNGELPRGYIWSIYNIEEFRVVDGSYLKLREVSMSYDFGKLNSFFTNMTVTASGRNLYSWDKFPSFDPETNSGGQSSVAKYNFGTVPYAKNLFFGGEISILINKTNMKKILLSIVVAGAFLVSCNEEFLDPTKPSQEEVLSTRSGLIGATNGLQQLWRQMEEQVFFIPQ